MIDLYTWTTPNGRKVSILLEELGVPYTAHGINIGQDEQFQPHFLDIAPNNKIPAIHDQETGVKMMESGAIMLYLAEKTGKFLGEGTDRLKCIEWLMWQMGGLGPMAGQTHHFVKFNKGTSEYAEKRYQGETARLYKVLNERLTGRDFITGEYTIADMACWPWISRFEWQEIDLNEFPALKSWYVRIAERPGTVKGYDVPKATTPIPMP
ncbi:MAG: glutathione S-transferase N-terminal domain-containing protein [Paracoccaceae bacterium]|mgnify:CR=1 FL=1